MKEIKKTYLVACSGGPDSMALLEMATKKKEVGAVAHVNYHHRVTADRDEHIVQDYCEKYDIPFFKLDVRRYRGNFQDYARVVRYKFFKKIVKKEKLDGVLIAHHLDDLLETYLLQKKRGSTPDYYGLKEETLIQEIPVVRPLLSYTKKELEEYCLSNNIPYGIDESNLSDDYARNQIRHSQIEKMTMEEKKKLKEEIDILNKEKEAEEQKVSSLLQGKKFIDFECYKKCTFKEVLLRHLIEKDISSSYLKDLMRQLEESETLKIQIGNEYLVKEYGIIEVFEVPKDYSFTITEYHSLRKKYFSLRKKGTSLEAVTVSEDDYPLTIRNARKEDAITLRFGKKKLNRFFIDRKIPFKERLSYPVVVNSKGEIILVPGIGSDISHYSHKANMFCVRIK